MKLGAEGLNAITTDDLKLLLRLVHRGELPCPIDARGLGMAGLLRLLDDLGHLRGLERAAVVAVLVAVLAERR